MISFAFIFLVRSNTGLLDELSLLRNALSFRSAQPGAKGSGTMELIGVGIALARVPFAELAFPTLGHAFAEACALGTFAMLTGICGAVDVVGVRGVLTGVVVGLALIDADTNKPVVTEGPSCVAAFSSEPFAWGFVVEALLPDVFDALLPSTALSSEEESSSYWMPLSKSRRRKQYSLPGSFA